MRGIALVLAILSTVVALAASPSCSTAQRSEEKPQKLEPIKISYSGTSGAQVLPYFIKQQGIFKKHGLDVEIISIPGGAPSVKALIAGDIQMAQVAGPAVVQAILNGADARIIMGVRNTLDLSLVVSKEIRTGDELRGKKLGILQFGDATDAAARMSLKRFGLDPAKDAAILQIGPSSQQLSALQAGGVDAVLIPPPFTLVASKMGYKELTNLAGADYQAATITAMRPFIDSKPDTIRRFLKAWAEGVRAYKQNKSAGMEAIGQFLKLEDQEAIAATYDYFAPQAQELPYPTLKGIQTILEGLIDTQPNAAGAKPEDFVDARFVKELEDSGFVNNLR